MVMHTKGYGITMNNRWEGNLADSAKVIDTLKAVKHKSGVEGGDGRHSLATTKEYIHGVYSKMAGESSVQLK